MKQRTMNEHLQTAASLVASVTQWLSIAKDHIAIEDGLN